MNEVQLIRRELAAQRQHGREVEASWNARPGILHPDNSINYNAYFLLILALESRRIESHLGRLRSRSDLSDAERRLLECQTREFETLTAARVPATTTDTVAHNVQSLNRLSMLAQALEAIAEAHYGVDDWRRASHIDADSILEERRLRKQALGEAHGPAAG